jgi:peptidoglycan/LPS O-acetylase OafA/YrhL
MIDVYRFILALCVLQAHLLTFGPHWLAAQAVFSFYVLSGFLMTLVLNQDYGFAWDGFVRFATNRALRLFPIYYIVIGLTALYIVVIGPLDQLNDAITLPRAAADWAINLSLVGLTGFTHVAGYRLAPTAWSLAVECFCYALLGLYFAKSRQRLLVMLAVGAVIAGIQIAGALNEPEYDLRSHYRVLQAGLIPFALGGLAYFFRQARLFAYSHGKFAMLCGLLVANFIGGYWSEFHAFVSGLYIVMILNVAFVPMLFGRPTTYGWQRTLGGIAYPFFLSHWAIASLLVVYIPAMGVGGLTHGVAATAATILFSLAMYYGVDHQVQRVRALIKSRNGRGYLRWPADPLGDQGIDPAVHKGIAA